ncbi:hypothetical protein C8R46DRAFT_1222964 [Mycena filopes]|nr:hypothetical protein C8R46DRAFT_1222964 [Mycena filopes]
MFNSLTYSIQTEIYRKGLDPEIATWDEIVRAAEKAEILLKIAAKNNGGRSSAYLAHQPEQSSGVQPQNYGHGKRSHGRFKPHRHGGQGDDSSPREEPQDSQEVMRTSSVEVPEKSDSMSAQRRSEMLAKGLCFSCAEPGHLARNCPDNNFSSHDALYESTEVLESFHVGSVRFGDLYGVEEGGEPLQSFAESENDFEFISEQNFEHDFEPEFNSSDYDSPSSVIEDLNEFVSLSGDEIHPLPSRQAVSDNESECDSGTHTSMPCLESIDDSSNSAQGARRLGDVLGNTVPALLEFSQPYPGGETIPWSDDRRDAIRFRALRHADFYVIEDTFFEECMVLPLEYIRERSFHLVEWYARRRAQAMGIDYHDTLPIHCFPIEELLADTIQQYFRSRPRVLLVRFQNTSIAM